MLVPFTNQVVVVSRVDEVLRQQIADLRVTMIVLAVFGVTAVCIIMAFVAHKISHASNVPIEVIEPRDLIDFDNKENEAAMPDSRKDK